MKVRFSHLSLLERRKIERWRQMKLNPEEMARRLDRHRSTIFRELRRNHFHDIDVPKLSSYWCVVAQSYSDGRRTRQRKLVREPRCRHIQRPVQIIRLSRKVGKALIVTHCVSR
jgi:transposase, IS30 family